MATTEGRVRQLISDNLEVDGQPLNLSDNLDTGLTAGRILTGCRRLRETGFKGIRYYLHH